MHTTTTAFHWSIFCPVGENVEKGVVHNHRTLHMASHSLALFHEGFCHKVQFHWFRSRPEFLQWADTEKEPNWKSAKARRDDFVLPGESWIFPTDGPILSPSWSAGWRGVEGGCQGGGEQAEAAWVLHQGSDWEPAPASDKNLHIKDRWGSTSWK